ncbi:ATP-dependent zinc protease family protein [Hydrocarboniclastica marina]|uniref:ATP-dependent zinc protease n=1 Tax=Hydrocarboniclastica marina TaxID=2259620 RepID=A0A4P7XGW7_9ALTE|nr:RimK/LysX family protein [Hydrocarboniclastica marina]QCF26268.1 ATP-dependent zinc protease [Hydrocarboniclastica marina]
MRLAQPATVFISIAVLLISGCASDYRAVWESDLSELKAQLQATERALVQLEKEQSASRDLLFVAETESMHRMVKALEEQVKAPECPAVEETPRCEAMPPPSQSSDMQHIDDGKLVIGEIEKVYVDPPGEAYTARIDTGATTSSLDAREPQIFERDGEDWVRFKMPLPGREEFVDVERKVAHFVRILQSSTEDSERRAVVKMRIVIGDVERLAEFTLSDRGHLEFPVLIGRNILKDTMVVDVSRANSVALPADIVSESSDE